METKDPEEPNNLDKEKQELTESGSLTLDYTTS